VPLESRRRLVLRIRVLTHLAATAARPANNPKCNSKSVVGGTARAFLGATWLAALDKKDVL
jgi:hypothetical protein